MRILEKIINNNKYTFVCEYWETYNAWGHKVTFFKNDIEYNVNKIRYYNRTWEAWTYQTAISGCIYKEIEDTKNRIKENYKYNNNIKRITKKHKEILQKIIDNDIKMQELRELKKAVNNSIGGVL